MGSRLVVDDHISRKYEIKKRIGKGAYGIVWKAIDRDTNQAVAVKKIFDAFCNQTDAQRTFREIMFLQEFREHPNIVKLFNVHRASNDRDIYLVFEYMETDLHKVIKRKHILQDLHKRYIMYQLLKATYYIHSGNVIHRDQKPSNILLDSYCRCKVADFGLARSLSVSEGIDGAAVIDPALTDYVATRWYRAPEILVASKQYTKGIDMWSLGCILAEMLLGKPLFPGSSTINQVERIMSTIEPPSPSDLACVCPGYGSTLFQREPAGVRVPLGELLRGAPPDGVDLVSRLLVLNPHKRLTASQALDHPYVSRFRRSAREPVMQRSVVPLLRDDIQLTVHEYRNTLYELMQHDEEEASAPASSSAGSGSPTSSSSIESGCSVKHSIQGQARMVKAVVNFTMHEGGDCHRKDTKNMKSIGKSKARRFNGEGESKSSSSSNSGKSATLSTPPLQKPMRLSSKEDAPRPAVRVPRHTRHLSTEDVRVRHKQIQQAHVQCQTSLGPLGRPIPLPTPNPAGQLSTHLLPNRLSVSDSAVSVPARVSHQLKRHCVGPPAHRGCHAQMNRVGVAAPLQARYSSGAGDCPSRPQLCQITHPGPGHKAARPKGNSNRGRVEDDAAAEDARGGHTSTHTHHCRSTASIHSQPQLAVRRSPLGYLQRPQPPASQVNHSNYQIISKFTRNKNQPTNNSNSRTKASHHAYFPINQQMQSTRSIGIISASALAELRSSYRWQR